MGSRPYNTEAMEQCKKAVEIHNAYRMQLTANKRLDFEIARLKNCGELKKQGIVFHPNSPYYSVCADVMLINPPGVVGEHTHSITSKEVDLSSDDKNSSSVEKEKVEKSSDQVSFLQRLWPFSQQVSEPEGADQLKALQIGQTQ